MGFLRSIVNWLLRFFGLRRPVIRAALPPPVVRVAHDPDSPAARLPEPRRHSFSRHGLLQPDTKCPVCAQPVDSEPLPHIHQLANGDEFIDCAHCGALLFASPDDAIDDVKPGRPYDSRQYHTFVRPTRAPAPEQRRYQDLILRRPVAGDWVVLVRCTTKDGLNLDGAEGRVLTINDQGTARVALAGNTGIGGSEDMGGNILWFPVTNLFPMLMHTLREGTPVRVVKGPSRGQAGRIISCLRAQAQVRLDADGAELSCPVEHVVPYHELQSNYIPTPPAPAQELIHG